MDLLLVEEGEGMGEKPLLDPGSTASRLDIVATSKKIALSSCFYSNEAIVTCHSLRFIALATPTCQAPLGLAILKFLVWAGRFSYLQ